MLNFNLSQDYETVKRVLRESVDPYYTVVRTSPFVKLQNPNAPDCVTVPYYYSPFQVQKRQSSWAFRTRIELETLMKLQNSSSRPAEFLTSLLPHDSKQAWFVTLTYDDDCIPTVEGGDWKAIRRDDITILFRHLRRYREKHPEIHSFSYFGSFEYGDKFLRPHVHLLLIGVSYDFVCHIASYWRVRHCPKSIDLTLPLESIDLAHLNDKEIQEQLIGVSVEHVGNSQGVISLDDCEKLSTYIGKYATKGSQSKFKKLEKAAKKHSLCFVLPRPCLIRPSRYFGTGALLLGDDSSSQQYYSDLFLDSLSDSLKCSNKPTLDGIYWNSNYLFELRQKLKISDSNGYVHKMPSYYLRKIFHKPCFEIRRTVLGKDGKFHCRTSSYSIQYPYDITQGYKKIPFEYPLLSALSLYGSASHYCDVACLREQLIQLFPDLPYGDDSQNDIYVSALADDYEIFSRLERERQLGHQQADFIRFGKESF